MTLTGGRLAVGLVVFWAVGVIAWNLLGLARIDAGQAPIGPTASLGAAGGGAVLGLLFVVGAARSRWLLVAVSLAVSLLAALAVYGAFSGAPSQWPGPGWRWGGALLNAIGVVGAVLALKRTLAPSA